MTASAAPIIRTVDAEPVEAKAKPAFGLTDEQVNDLEAQHGRLGSFRNESARFPYQVVVRAPKRAEYKRFRSMANEQARRADAQETLVRSIVVAVYWKGAAYIGEAKARDALDELLDVYPAAADSGPATGVVEKLVSGAVADDSKD